MIKKLCIVGSLFVCCFSSLSFADEFPKEFHFSSGQSLERLHPTVAGALLSEAFGRHGIKLVFHSFPTQRSYRMVNEGEIDGEMHRVRDFIKLVGEHGKNLVRLDTKLFDVYFAVFTRRGYGKQNVKSVDDLIGQSVAYRDGRKNAKSMLAPLETQINIVTTPSDDNAFRMLALGRVDYVLAGSWESQLMLSSFPQNFQGIEEVGRLSRVGLYAFVNKKHVQLSKVISQTLAEMKSDGTSKKIITSIIGEVR